MPSSGGTIFQSAISTFLGSFILSTNPIRLVILIQCVSVTIAGFPYKFVLKGNGEEKALSYLVPSKMTEEDKVEHIENHLSWGEKNAFSLVMFMFEAVSDGADLIVLDDPITSFDKDKKFAVVRRLFEEL